MKAKDFVAHVPNAVNNPGGRNLELELHNLHSECGNIQGLKPIPKRQMSVLFNSSDKIYKHKINCIPTKWKMAE